jgi:MFS transporter, BCD family, chlorophyll transporter
MASNGRESREGVRMGLWGAAQAIAFGLGSFFGAAMSDVARLLLGSPVAAYSTVFAFEAVLFLVAAVLAYQISPAKDFRHSNAGSKPSESTSRDSLVASLTGRA